MDSCDRHPAESPQVTRDKLLDYYRAEARGLSYELWEAVISHGELRSLKLNDRASRVRHLRSMLLDLGFTASELGPRYLV